ncbi:MAG: VWA domain-containing protein [Pirellulales bacterium]|nr:VWA domain-containing protein [Pirellulales bacterium]
MFDYQLSFGSPWYLTLLVLLPLVWWLSVRSIALVGRIRWLIVNVLRTVVLLGLILALADVQWVRISDRLTVIYLLDQSLSIPAEQRRTMIEYVNAEILEHRDNEGDRAGVIVFGRDAAIEIPPFDDDVQLAPMIESLLDPEYTNLAGAIKLAQASFPEDAAKRIVLVSDGNQNLGDVAEQAQRAAGAGIGIDVVPIDYQSRAEVVVERLAIPTDIRQGQAFDLKVVATNTATDGGEIHGRLVLSQLTGGEPEVLSEERVTLPPGKKVFTIRQTIDRPNFYTYEAKIVPDKPEDDTMPQNNRATAFTHVRGKGQVLLIEDSEHPGEFDQLVERLRQQNLEVDVQSTSQLFTTPGDLLPYDTVVLANVPRSTGEGDEVYHFTDEQIEMLVRNTQQMGAGLVMLGGPSSFGAGGWSNTELEKAMPVDFQIKSAKVAPKGALVMIMHACEIGQGNHWQKVIAQEAIKTLGEHDYCGLLQWSGTDQWLWGQGLARVGGNRNKMMAAVSRMTPSDMPQFDPSMQMALRGFRKVPDAAVKHMIIISDGDPSPPSRGVLNALIQDKVTISTVAVGAHGPAESRLLANIASAAGGKYYACKNPKALPRIYQREVRRVARPLVYERDMPWNVQVNFPHEMIGGIDALPPINGFVLTSKKDNPLVEVALVSPQPAGERNSTILASWTYGLGKAVAFTTDAGARWTKQWPDSAAFDQLFGQVVRWSMRPTGESANFTVATQVEGEQVQVVVTALDKEGKFLNFLNMAGAVEGPDLQRIPLEMRQTAPGRYVGAFPASAAGSYFVAITHGLEGEAPILTGVNVPYSDEFRDRAANEALMAELAERVPAGGKPGQVIKSDPGDKLPDGMLKVDTFRHGELPKATSSQDVWFYVVLLGSCLFFFDVFFRRVQVSLLWIPPLVGRAVAHVLGRDVKPAEVETMQRLRSRKAEVSGRIEQLRADARFEAPPEAATDLEALQKPAGPTPPAKPRAGPGEKLTEEAEEKGYTERLLRAKEKVWDRRKGHDQK